MTLPEITVNIGDHPLGRIACSEPRSRKTETITMVAQQTDRKLENLVEQLKQEIKERKQIEKSLREQTLRNERILETAMDGFHILDMDGTIVKVNRSAAVISGYSQEEMIGMNAFELGTRETRKEMSRHLKDLMEKGAHRFETQRRHKNGKIIDVEVSTNYVKMGKEKFIFSFFHDIRKRKQEERSRKEREAELEIKNATLEEMNTALKVLLAKREEDKAELEDNIMANLDKLVFPFIEKMKTSGVNDRQRAYVEIVESSLKDVVSPFSRKLTTRFLNLTPTEMHVANLVKEGKTTKEIAELLNLGDRTIESHRKGIRKKLGIQHKKVNLRSYLTHLQ